jgi:hypothetical protein
LRPLRRRRGSATHCAAASLSHPTPRLDQWQGSFGPSGGPQEVLMEGYLYKQSSNMVRDWKRRWFLITVRGWGA